MISDAFILCLVGMSVVASAWMNPSMPLTTRPCATLSTRNMVSDVDTLSEMSIEDLKADLISFCSQSPKPLVVEVQQRVLELEELAEMKGIGQSSSFSGCLSGEWELVYSPEDVTRSSPFFWAFRKAFPDQSDQIFGITDAIPAPIKEIGPAYQEIDLSTDTGKGTFVSKVKVATLGGLATSIMTTRASITGVDGVDGIQLQIETTKPEDSTAVNTLLGPLGSVVNENLPPFPSGKALEQVQPGSSTVTMVTTFCDEGFRVSRNADKMNEPFLWRRRAFSSFEML